MQTFAAYIDPDDVEQETALARIEAERRGSDPDEAAAIAAAAWVAGERRVRCKVRPASTLNGAEHSANSLDWLPDAKKLVGLHPAKARTAGQRRRGFRDLLILVGSLAGLSQRDLAAAFGLPPSRVCAILAAMKRRTGVIGP